MVSGTQQVEQPEPFSGGVIADPMGFGKTLTMIALVSTDKETDKPRRGFEISHQTDNSSEQTLVVVPPPSKIKLHQLHVRQTCEV